MTTEIVIHNVETGEIVEREMTADELAQYQIDVAKAADEAQAQAQKAVEKAALLEKLGISEDEAKLLLG